MRAAPLSCLIAVWLAACGPDEAGLPVVIGRALWDAPAPALVQPAEADAELVDARLGRRLGAGEPASLRLPAGVGTGDVLHLSASGAGISLAILSAAGEERLHETCDGGAAWLELELELEPGDAKLVVEAREADALVADVYVTGRRSSSRPPVLLVSSDTHRADQLGAASPTLDLLAQRGLRFTAASAPTNVTNPSHVALMTGRHPLEAGILHNERALAEAAPTLAEAFAAAGWRTLAVVSASHLGDPGSGLGQGFDRMAWPVEPMSDAPVAVEHLLEELDEAGPVFAWLHLFDAHWPYEPPADDLARYWPEGKDPFDPELPALGVDDEVLPDDLRGLRDAEFPRAAYRGEITALDRELGRVLPRFAAGLIAVVGDHGESFGEHGVWYTHAELYPQTLRVPLILSGDVVAASWTSGERPALDAPAVHTDLGRTLLDLAGLSAVAHPGRSLLAAAPELPRFAIASHGFSASVSYRGLHAVLHLRNHRQKHLARGYPRHQLELYDLRADPDCLADLADSRPDEARELRSRLIDWLAATRAEDWQGPGGAEPETLAQLGYAGAAEAQTLWVPDDCAWCRRFEP